MKKKKNEPSAEVVTWIEETLPINLTEIAEAQQSTEELDLDSDLADLPEELPETEDASESLEAQLDRLTRALSSRQEETTGFEQPKETEGDPALLATQIAEAEALETIQRSLLLDQIELNPNGSDPESREFPRLSLQTSELTHDGLTAPSSARQMLPGEPIVELIPETLDQAELQSSVEALLFLADKPMSVEKLHQLLGPDYDLSLFEAGMKELVQRYHGSHHGIELVEVAGGYQFRTKPGRATLAKKLVKVQTQRLSGGALETLAVVAYRQPVMKEDIDQVRGVDSSYFIRNLLDRKMIKISGRSELPGRPMLYETTTEFLEIFGLKNLSSLPSLRELEQMIPGSETGRAEDEDPRIRDMRRMVSEMHADRESILHYNPSEDEKILQEIREKVKAIPTSTPYLDDLKAAEVLVQQQATQQAVQNQETTGQPAQE